MSPTDAAAPTQAAGSPESLARRARRVLSPVRLVFLVHRWLGIGLGILMAVWCLSGFVMMYVGYPEMTEPGRRAGLAAVDWSDCCTTPTWLALGGEQVRSARIEMRAGLPLMYWRDGAGAPHVTNLATGGDAPPVDAAAARRVASDYAARLGLAGAPSEVETLAYDQWTMLPAVRALGPFYKVSLNDAAGSEIYVSSGTGAVAAATSARERFWNWPGAVTHWLYFTELRRRSDTWYWFVVWTSLLGCFLTGTGLYTGIRMFGRGRRQFSPYRGFSYVHHLAGLGFGLLAFAWVGSGLVSMNPWGFLEGQGARDEVERLQGGPTPSEDVVGLLRALAANPPSDSSAGGIVQIELQRFLGETGVIVHRADGSVARLDPRTLDPAPLDEDALARAAGVMLDGAAPASAGMIDAADAYYFGHKEDIVLPAYRAIATDEAATRYYLDPTSGALIAKIDRDAKLYRWLHYGFHRWDFFAGLRARPVWDFVVIPLLLGVACLTLTGAWLGVRRLGRKVSKLL